MDAAASPQEEQNREAEPIQQTPRPVRIKRRPKYLAEFISK